MRLFYEAWYRVASPPWSGAPRSELVELVTSGALTPGRVLDLGCGEGDNAVFLAQHGFEVTAVDFAPAAIAKARRKARAAGVSIAFLVDDLTRPRLLQGPFDLLVDYGTLDDLGPRERDAYVRTVLPLGGPGSHFLLWCFEWDLRRWERIAMRLLPFGGLALAPGEALRRFGPTHEIVRLAGEHDLPTWPRGWAAYLMSRRNPQPTEVPTTATSFGCEFTAYGRRRTRASDTNGTSRVHAPGRSEHASPIGH